MLPNSFSESARDVAQRQANYLILSSLESKLSKPLFDQILQEVSAKMQMPRRLTWDGNQNESAFSDLKVSMSSLDDGFLARVLEGVAAKQKSGSPQETSILTQNNLSTLLKHNYGPQNLDKRNLYSHLRARVGNFAQAGRREVGLTRMAQFERMKTVFCHADLSKDEVSSIFNVKFDQSDRFVISGADDGCSCTALTEVETSYDPSLNPYLFLFRILKIFDRETLTLQASLHGHTDYITDVDVSKCNRFVASAGKDAQVIIWDLKLGKIVKRFKNHNQQINRISFFSPRARQQQQAASGSSSQIQTSQNTAFLSQRSEQGPPSTVVKEQYLFSCSDDGTVHLYDFSPLSKQQSRSRSNTQEMDEFRVRRSARRTHLSPSVENSQRDEVDIFDVELTPDDFRPGHRNKKLDTLEVSQSGLVVAGTNTGEILVWKLSFSEIARRNKRDVAKFIGQFKIHKNAGIQFLEFSPKNDMLMTGSTDGVVKIWKMDQGTNKKGDHQKQFSFDDQSRLLLTMTEKGGCVLNKKMTFTDDEGVEQTIYSDEKAPVEGRFKVQSSQNFTKSQCDALSWSANGRFAITSITSQLESHSNGEDEQHDEVCRLKIWDTVNETFYDDLARPSGLSLKKNTWVLAPHPFYEEILMTGSDGGSLILWNIHTKQIIKKFNQYGVYSIDGYVMDNPLDGRFSHDGTAFIVGSQLGTITLFTNDGHDYQYEATRVQQFFEYDAVKDGENHFEKQDKHPQICGYNLVPYEVQPSRPLIGQFATAEHSPDKTRQLAEEFERNLMLGKEMGRMEEKYYQDQLKDCQGENLYNANVFEEGRQRLENLEDSPAVRPDEEVPEDQPMEQEPEPDFSPDTRRSAARSGRRRVGRPARNGRLQRNTALSPVIMANYSSDEGSEARQPPEDFEEIQSDFDEEDASSSSDADITEEHKQFERRRSNMHDGHNIRPAAEVQQQSRAARARRRAGVESDSESPEPAGGRNLRRRARRNFNESDSESEMSVDEAPRVRPRREEIEEEKHAPEEQRRGRNRAPERPAEVPRRAGGRLLRAGSRPNFNEQTEEANSHHDLYDSDEEPARRLRQRTSQRPARLTRNSSQVQNSMDSSEQLNGRRNRRRLVDSSENSAKPSVQKRDANTFWNEVGNLMSDEEMKNDTTEERRPQMGSASTNVQADTDYTYFQNSNELIKYLGPDYKFDRKCTFCNREDTPLIGPFCKIKNIKSDLVGKPLFFHMDCIEKSTYSFFRKSDKAWVNIGTALKHLVDEQRYNCVRCDTTGATVQCESCNKPFHGFKCSNLLTISLGFTENVPGGHRLQCLFCRNRDNHVYFSNLENIKFNDKRIFKIHTGLSRDHLLEYKNVITQEQERHKTETYLPQLNDLVYYFWQGHEEYMMQYSCYFYSGQNEEIKKRVQMPYLKDPQMRKKEFVLCKVTKIVTIFPNQSAIELMDLYGQDTTDVTQSPQLVQRITLSVVKQKSKKEQKFIVDLFPNTLPDFLVLSSVVDNKMKQLTKLVDSGQFENKTFTVVTKQGEERVKVVKANASLEPTLYPHSMWKSILVTSAGPSGRSRGTNEMPQHRSQRRRDDPISDQETQRISFWEIKFDMDYKKLARALLGFDSVEQEKLLNELTKFIEKEREYLVYYMDRVTLDIAPDYRSIITQDMYFSLIKKRLANGYYRSSDQVLSDLDLISYNAEVYNGKDHEIAVDAASIVEKIRLKMKQSIYTKAESRLAEMIKQSGKLTAPARLRVTDNGAIADKYSQLARDARAQLEQEKQQVLAELGMGLVQQPSVVEEEQIDTTIRIQKEPNLDDQLMTESNIDVQVDLQVEENKDDGFDTFHASNGIPAASATPSDVHNFDKSGNNKIVIDIADSKEKIKLQTPQKTQSKESASRVQIALKCPKSEAQLKDMLTPEPIQSNLGRKRKRSSQHSEDLNEDNKNTGHVRRSARNKRQKM